VKIAIQIMIVCYEVVIGNFGKTAIRNYYDVDKILIICTCINTEDFFSSGVDSCLWQK